MALFELHFLVEKMKKKACEWERESNINTTGKGGKVKKKSKSLK